MRHPPFSFKARTRPRPWQTARVRACAARRAPAARSAGSGRCSYCGRRRSGAWRPGSRRGRGFFGRHRLAAAVAHEARACQIARSESRASRCSTASHCSAVSARRAGRRARRCGCAPGAAPIPAPAAERCSQVELAEQVRAAADTIGIDVELAAELRFDIELGEPGRRVRRASRPPASSCCAARSRGARARHRTAAAPRPRCCARPAARGRAQVAQHGLPGRLSAIGQRGAMLRPQVGPRTRGPDGERAGGQRHLAPAPDELGLQDAHAGLFGGSRCRWKSGLISVASAVRFQPVVRMRQAACRWWPLSPGPRALSRLREAIAHWRSSAALRSATSRDPGRPRGCSRRRRPPRAWSSARRR